jgi:hypothetical protein
LPFGLARDDPALTHLHFLVFGELIPVVDAFYAADKTLDSPQGLPISGDLRVFKVMGRFLKVGDEGVFVAFVDIQEDVKYDISMQTYNGTNGLLEAF